MTTEQTRALNALNYICGMAVTGVHLREVHESLENSFMEVYKFIYPDGSDEQESPDLEPKEAPCECDL